jgi:hypothetical protein
VVSFTPRPLYSQGKSPGTHWIGGWVHSRAVLDVVVKRKIPNPHQESNPGTPYMFIKMLVDFYILTHCIL